MLYEDCIEFFASSWTQTHTIECETGFGSPHITLQGDCEGIPVTCALWIDQQPLGESYRNQSRGLFAVTGKMDSLNRVRSSTKRISMDVHISEDIYGGILDTLHRHQEAQRSLAFSAYSLMRENAQHVKQTWFEVLKFEVSESVTKS